MTKYEQVCKAVDTYERDRIAYRNHSVSALAQIMRGFVQYLGAPVEFIRYRREMTDGDAANYSPETAVSVSDDGWWKGYVTLIRPRTHSSWCFQLRNELDYFQVRIGDSSKIHSVSTFTAEHLEPIWQEAFSRSLEFLTTGAERFVEATRAQQAKGIGFLVDIPESGK